MVWDSPLDWPSVVRGKSFHVSTVKLHTAVTRLRPSTAEGEKSVEIYSRLLFSWQIKITPNYKLSVQMQAVYFIDSREISSWLPVYQSVQETAITVLTHILYEEDWLHSSSHCVGNVNLLLPSDIWDICAPFGMRVRAERTRLLTRQSNFNLAVESEIWIF